MAQVAFHETVVMIPGFDAEVVCTCGWVGVVSVYDIGDGPEWCCPNCDWCCAPTAELLADGTTQAVKNMERLVEKHRAELGPFARRAGWEQIDTVS